MCLAPAAVCSSNAAGVFQLHLRFDSPLSTLMCLLPQMGQLAELLVVLGHATDAALLQQQLATLMQCQAAAAADVLAHPPPTLAFTLPRPQQQGLAAAIGPAAAAAASATLATLPGPALQQQVSAAESAVRQAHWKWDILREAPGSNSSGGVDAAGS